MKKIFISFAIILFTMLCCNTVQAKPGDNYNPQKAISYADSCFKKKGKTYKVSYSKKYGKDLCAGYVSQCLKEGGVSMDKTWYWYSKSDNSLTWRVSKMLFSYLKKSGYKLKYSPNASDIKPGDVIFYWTNGGWGHCAICVDKKADGTPKINAYNSPHYHFSYWTLGYKTCVFSMEGKVDKPVISADFHTKGKKITLECDTEDVDIYYTLDGKTPSEHSKKYNSSFVVNKNCKVRAIGIKTGMKNSDISSKSIDTKKIIESGVYYIKNKNIKNKVLACTADSTTKNSILSFGKSSAKYNKKFKLKYKGSGKYTITSAETKSDIVESNSNLWRISAKKSDAFTITHHLTGKYLSTALQGEKAYSLYATDQRQDVGQVWNFSKTSLSKLKLDRVVAPKSLKKGTSFVINGNISSNYAIKFIKVEIKNKLNKTMASNSATPNSKIFSIRKLSSKIYFGKLKAGKYKYIISGYDSTKANKVLFNSSFSVTKK